MGERIQRAKNFGTVEVVDRKAFASRHGAMCFVENELEKGLQVRLVREALIFRVTVLRAVE